MANYYGYGRTNYVEVTDEAKFMDLISNHVMSGDEDGIEIGVNNGKFTIYGSMAGYINNENDDPDYDLLLDKLQELLPDNEALIIEEIGHEKLRYLVGDLTIITNKEIRTHSFDKTINDFIKENPEYNDITKPEY